eukprot:g8140.t1
MPWLPADQRADTQGVLVRSPGRRWRFDLGVKEIDGQRLTVADISLACSLSAPFQKAGHEKLRESHPNSLRWLLTSLHHIDRAMSTTPTPAPSPAAIPSSAQVCSTPLDFTTHHSSHTPPAGTMRERPGFTGAAHLETEGLGERSWAHPGAVKTLEEVAMAAAAATTARIRAAAAPATPPTAAATAGLSGSCRVPWAAPCSPVYPCQWPNAFGFAPPAPPAHVHSPRAPDARRELTKLRMRCHQLEGDCKRLEDENAQLPGGMSQHECAWKAALNPLVLCA